MINLFKRFFYYICLFFLSFSCRQGIDEVLVDSSEPPLSHFITQEEALLNLDKDIQFAAIKSSNTNAGRKSAEMIKNIIPLRVIDPSAKISSEVLPTLYVANLRDGGYAVLSADDRAELVLALSSVGELYNGVKAPQGLIAWFKAQNQLIQDIRKGSVLIDTSTVIGRKSARQNALILKQVGPLLTTRWGQHQGYNDLLNASSCSSGKYPTGCVATAVGQVMKYNRYPSNYNWDNMPDDGDGDIPTLMKDIGQAVNMQYSCLESGAWVSDAGTAFVNQFAYTNAQMYSNGFNDGYNSRTGIANASIYTGNIDNNRPFIVSGYADQSCAGWWIFESCSFSSGHAWVCDGYRKDQIRVITGGSKNGLSYADVAVTRLHFNWGWDGNYNGWYSISDWATDVDTGTPVPYYFQFIKEALLNITKP